MLCPEAKATRNYYVEAMYARSAPMCGRRANTISRFELLQSVRLRNLERW